MRALELDDTSTAEAGEVMESRLRLVEAKLKEHGEKIQTHQEQLHAISMQLARMQALQDALAEQEEKNFQTNNDQHRALFNKLDDIIEAVAERKGLFKGFAYKMVGLGVLVFLIAAASYYFPVVHDFFHNMLEIMQGHTHSAQGG